MANKKTSQVGYIISDTKGDTLKNMLKKADCKIRVVDVTTGNHSTFDPRTDKKMLS